MGDRSRSRSRERAPAAADDGEEGRLFVGNLSFDVRILRTRTRLKLRLN